ncbi:MAG: glycosyltransferase [Candidatus Bathyarchaeota archaeon]|nr:glycosyltransferase [Candidatus Bathyarchaeota archaeon]
MKILQVIPRFNPILGGGVNVVYNVSKGLAEMGHDVTVLTTKCGLNEDTLREMAELGIEVIPFDYVFDFHLFIYSPRIKKWLSENVRSFDVIHLNGARSYQNNVVLKFAREYSVPYVLQPHGSILRIVEFQTFKKVYDAIWGYALYKNASRLLALNKTEADACVSMGVEEPRISLVSNGIDSDMFKRLPEAGLFRKRFCLKASDKIVLYLGRLHKSKGLGLLLEAFAQVAANVCDAKLVMVGPDGGHEPYLKKLSRQLGIADKMIFAGTLSEFDKKCALVDADVFVTPRFYGFPIAFLEAMACGVPIVTTNAGDVIDELHDNFGYVTKYNSSDLSQAITAILKNSALRQRFSENETKQLYCYDWNNILENINAVYHELVGT